MKLLIILSLLMSVANADEIVFPRVNCRYPDDPHGHTYLDVKVDQSSIFLGIGQADFFIRLCDKLRENRESTIKIKPRNFEIYRM